LGDIDVAEPGHARLVEKERLERAIRVREERGEPSRSQRAAERLDAEDLELGEHSLIAAADRRDVSEAAWIDVAKLATAIEAPDGVRVGRARLLGAADEKVSAHAEMNDERAAARGVKEEVLREPAELEDAMPDGHRGDALDIERSAEAERLAA